MEENREQTDSGYQQHVSHSHERSRYLAGYLAGLATALVASVVVIVIYAVAVNGNFKLGNYNKVGDVTVNKNEVVDESKNDIIKKIEYLSGIIATYYLEDVESADIVEGIYKGIFESLNDPYSEYYTADEYQEMTNRNNGQFVGIGVVVKLKDDGEIHIESFLEGGNAQKSGLKIDDIITKVDGREVANQKYDEVVDWIKGEEGTNVSITVRREKDGVPKEYTYDIERALVDNISVSSKVVEDNIGYIYISAYEANTSKQFKSQLQELIDKGIKGLIIDERYNGGGLLTSVTEIADCLMDEGVLVTIKDKNGNVTKEVETTNETMLDVPLVLLVDENSASASEVLAGAVKDRGIGKLVGVKTYGKGIVQSIIPLNDGSAVKVTTERYYTPSGEYIHKVGIKPDVEVELDTAKAEEGVDNQYDKAVEVLKEMMEE